MPGDGEVGEEAGAEGEPVAGVPGSAVVVGVDPLPSADTVGPVVVAAGRPRYGPPDGRPAEPGVAFAPGTVGTDAVGAGVADPQRAPASQRTSFAEGSSARPSGDDPSPPHNTTNAPNAPPATIATPTRIRPAVAS